ncbi:MAG: ribonuclease R, partial [Paracoccaceae bacterium]
MSKLPSRQDILDWVRDNPAKGSRRDIGRAFAIKGAARIELKRMLREMARDGLLEKRTHRSDDPNALPPVGVLRVLAPDTQGDLFAEPTQWQGERPVPRIPIVGKRTGHEPGEGDRILARLTPTPQGEFGHEARIIRRIGTGARRILGLYRKGTEGGRIKSIDKGAGREWRVAEADRLGASDGDLVEAEQSGPKSRLGLPWARITEVLGDPMAPKSVSLFAIHAHGIPDAFPDTVLAEAEAVMSAGTGERVDLSHLAFITIDPADARDHDDAVFAEPDE